MNEADWNPSSLVEGEAVSRRRRLRRHDWIALSLGGSLLTILTAFVVFAALNRLAFDVALAIIAIYMAVAFAVAALVDRRRAALVQDNAEADSVLRAEFGEGRAWFVDLLVIRGATPVGADRGMLWIDEGRLIFSEHRTSFALSSDQVRRVRREIPIPSLRHEIALDLNRSDTTQIVSIRPLEVPAMAEDEIGPELVGWRKTAVARGGQLPPITRGPGALPTSRLLVGALWSTFYWSLVALLVFLVDLTAAPSIVFVGLLLGWLVQAWYPTTRWHAWRDRRRLERG